MAQVYQHSFLTLAATVSSGDSQGCYSEHENNGGTMEINIPPSCSTPRQIVVRKPLPHWVNLPLSTIKTDYPLLSRAWVFQERLLSPRVLHFCGSELVWECRETTTCECGSLTDTSSPGGEYHRVLRTNESKTKHNKTPAFPDLRSPSALQEHINAAQNDILVYISKDRGVSLSHVDRQLKKRAEENLDKLKVLLYRYETIIKALKRIPGPSELSQQYRNLVEQYSALQLTKTTDRLPALSGLCERVKHLRGDYLAGIWADSIWLDLLWRVIMLEPNGDGYQLSQNRYPTWSWVSVQTPISYWDDIKSVFIAPPDYYHNEHFNYAALEVCTQQRRPFDVKYYVELAGMNPFGEVSSAVLWIKSLSCDAIIQSTLSSNPKLMLEGLEVPFSPDYVLGVVGPHRVLDGSVATLLLIHPQIALVLIPTRSLDKHMEKMRDPELVQLALEAGVWERIGIARVSEAFLNVYEVDWMRSATVGSYVIV
jgi:hypothetical protein